MFVAVIYSPVVPTDNFVFVPLLKMIDELMEQMFKHSWWMLVCFEIQLSLPHNSPLLGVEFNKLVSSDLQILDSQRRLPSRWASFLGLSPSKVNPFSCVLYRHTNRVIFLLHSLQRSQKVIFYHQKKQRKKTFSVPSNPSSPSEACEVTTGTFFVCRLCGLFSVCRIHAPYFLKDAYIGVQVCIHTNTLQSPKHNLAEV